MNSMKKIKSIWDYLIKKFWTKQFIIFICIGVLNTLIDTVICWVLRTPMHVDIILAGTISFFVASLFSYFANSRFTFSNRNYTMRNLVLTMVVFGVRWGIMSLFTLLLVWICGFTPLIETFELSQIDVACHFFASVLTIPASYIFLEMILKIKPKTENKTSEKSQVEKQGKITTDEVVTE